ncbi:type 1 glutamine amidotransferase domain-containing protein [Roseivirga sp. E12]|uniref:type 1 glutamine amidotransferase domain-containing protein n=1 Tax=Roseivirga sp. E12 TaxID=2819237 RepID=UPI001ABC1F7B|nr:type 1 glutamine amidotransferase domain-containing protein [Roseivirga sp. E12]MBO3697740.1 type 1 glutamine amidotransferase domain-containing protein [Roseivirga sp. E12]
MKNILFIITSCGVTGTGKHAAGYEFSEVADPYFEFTSRGYIVDFASILGGTPPYVGYDKTQESSRGFRESKAFNRLNFSHKLSNVDVDAYDAIFFPGGLGPMTDMVNNPLIKETIKKVYERGHIIGAVCHGPAALLNVTLSNGKNLLEARHINSFTISEEIIDKHTLGDVIPFILETELKNQGANFSHTTPFDPYVTVDDNLVTGQNPASASDVAIKMIDLLVE